jgi:hypothetical protein
MVVRTGIFAGLRRRRWALGLAFGYALLLNALLGTSVEGALAAAGTDPLAAAAVCGPADPAPAGHRHPPADHQQTCPLCGPACPMGSAPLHAAAGAVTFAAPGRVSLAAVVPPCRAADRGRGLYASDVDSQGPPAA